MVRLLWWLQRQNGGAQRSGLSWGRGRLAPDVLHQLCDSAQRLLPGPAGDPSAGHSLCSLKERVQMVRLLWWLRVENGGALCPGRGGVSPPMFFTSFAVALTVGRDSSHKQCAPPELWAVATLLERGGGWRLFARIG